MSQRRKRITSKVQANYSCTIPTVTLHRHCPDVQSLKEANQEGERTNWAGFLLNIPSVWRKTQGEGIRVAVLDTGVDEDHPDLADAIVDAKDFTGDGVEDKNGHGTHCAGIIAARKNGVGFVGVAPKADLLIAKVLGNDGGGRHEWIAAGVEWAVRRKCDIISMSLGSSISSTEIYQTIHTALSKGIMFTCAAGNSGGLYRNSINYPGRYGSVITVAAHDEDGNPSGFSSRGGEIDVMAPGARIWSTYSEGSYAELSGTSMATPFVAGISALILSKHRGRKRNGTPVDNNSDLKEHLLRMAAHPGYHDNITGYGPLLPFSYFSDNSTSSA